MLRPSHRPKALALLCSLPLLALSACADGGSPPSGPTPSISPRAVSGTEQSGAPGRELGEPLVLEVFDADGAPAAGLAVAWSTPDGGTLSPAQGTTDAAGRASVRWTLGPAEGVQSAAASLEGKEAVRFTATARRSRAAAVDAASDTALAGRAGAALGEALAVRVLDADGAPLAGAEVTWRSPAGGGAITPERSVTDAAGVARAVWTLGPRAGTQAAEAIADTLAPVTFRARSAVAVGPAGGVVESVDGRLRLEIPAGALAGEALITADRSEAGPEDDQLVAGSRYDLGPDGLTFAVPATLSLVIDADSLPAGALGANLAAHRLSEGAWTEVMGSRADTVAAVVTAPLTGFSVYALRTRRAVDAVKVAPARATVSALGAATLFRVSLFDAGGRALDPAARTVRWNSSDETVATVDSNGRAEAVGLGEATIAASVGEVEGDARLKVALVAAQVQVEPGSATLTARGATLPLRARVEDALGARIPGMVVEWESSDAAVATVDAAGIVTAVGPGTATVWARAGGARDGAQITVAVPATRLALLTAPSDTVVRGVAFPAQPVLRLEDASGNAVAEAGVVVTATILTGSGTLGGTATVSTDAAGEAAFADLSIGGASGAHALAFSAAGLTGDTVDLYVTAAPSASADSVATASAPGDTFHVALGDTLSVAAGAGSLLANDDLGGGALISHFGAIQTNDGAGTLNAASGTVTTNAAGVTVAVGDGSLRVNADGSLVFAPPTNYTGLLRFQYRLANGLGTDDATVTLAVGVRPEAVDDAYDVLGNVPISVPGASGLFANDTGDRLAYVGAAHVSGTTGTLSIGVGSGAVLYTPAAGYEGTDVFTYTIRNGFGSSQGSLTFTIGGMIWFVDENATSPGNGRLGDPFRTLAELTTVEPDEAGDAIFLYESATAYTGGITLKDGQRLIGQDATQPLDSIAGVTLPPHSDALPSMNPGAGAAVALAGGAGGVTLGQDNEVHGLRIDVDTGIGLSGTDYGTLVVRDVAVESDTDAIYLDGGTANVQIASVVARGGGNSVAVVDTDGPLSFGDVTISNPTATAIHLDQLSGPVTFGDVTITNRATGGISIVNAADTVSFGTVTIDNTAAAATPAITLTTAARVIMTGDHDIDMASFGFDDAIVLRGTTLEIEGGTIRNSADEAIAAATTSNLRLTDVTISGTGGRAMELAGGQYDISGSTFENIASDGISLSANNNEFRLRIADSRIGGVGLAYSNGWSIRSNAAWASIVLDDVTFGPRDDGTLTVAPPATAGTGNCVSLRNVTPDAPLHATEYDLDGSSATIRYEEPTVGVIGTVAKTNVTDVAPGTCVLPDF